jgi:hypothetical protein
MCNHLFINTLRLSLFSNSQIYKATLKTAWERFCKPWQPDAQSCAKQNNIMMSICLAKSLTEDTQARLLSYRNQYTLDGVEYAPLMYKIIMHLDNMDSVAATQTLHNNLQLLGVFAATVSNNINEIYNKFEENYSQLLARHVTVVNPIGILFDAYLMSHLQAPHLPPA